MPATLEHIKKAKEMLREISGYAKLGPEYRKLIDGIQKSADVSMVIYAIRGVLLPSSKLELVEKAVEKMFKLLLDPAKEVADHITGAFKRDYGGEWSFSMGRKFVWEVPEDRCFAHLGCGWPVFAWSEALLVETTGTVAFGEVWEDDEWEDLERFFDSVKQFVSEVTALTMIVPPAVRVKVAEPVRIPIMER